MLVRIKDSLGLTFINMRKVICCSLALLIVFILPNTISAQTVETVRFEFEGEARKFIVVLPQSYNSNSNMPIVFLLHGAGGGTIETAQQFLGWIGTDFADSVGYIAVYPQAIRDINYWCGSEFDDVALDVNFIDAVIATLNSNYSINLKKI